MLLTVILPILFVLICVPIIFVLYGITRWQAESARRRMNLEGSRAQIMPRIYDTGELHGLPTPVQHYFRAVLKPGQPIVATAEMGQEGQINLGGTQEQWVDARSTQVVVTQRPGFDWDARIRKAPWSEVFVHDTYVAGAAWLHAALFGLLRLMDLRDRPELARGELMRFLAEAAWYPTRLLPSQGVHWEAIDGESARATLADGENQVALTFEFDAGGLIRTVRADARPRLVGRDLVETPWEGRFWGYEERGGMRIPLQGEVAWILPEGRIPYWRGRVTDVLYRFTP